MSDCAIGIQWSQQVGRLTIHLTTWPIERNFCGKISHFIFVLLTNWTCVLLKPTNIGFKCLCFAMDNSDLASDPFENSAPLSQPTPTTSYLDNVVDISDDDFEIPCSQKRHHDRWVLIFSKRKVFYTFYYNWNHSPQLKKCFIYSEEDTSCSTKKSKTAVGLSRLMRCVRVNVILILIWIFKS